MSSLAEWILLLGLPLFVLSWMFGRIWRQGTLVGFEAEFFLMAAALTVGIPLMKLDVLPNEWFVMLCTGAAGVLSLMRVLKPLAKDLRRYGLRDARRLRAFGVVLFFAIAVSQGLVIADVNRQARETAFAVLLIVGLISTLLALRIQWTYKRPGKA